MRVALIALIAACSAAPVAVLQPRPTVAVAATVSVAVTATATATAPETASVTAPPPPKRPSPKVVLHLGDSMVGGYGGLTKALEAKFKELGSKFVRDWETSVSIYTFDHEHRLQELIAKSSPDLVILTLGANDVFVPFPSSLAPYVRSIAHKMSEGERDCYWITPPIWKKDTGIVDVIKNNATPCKVFDASTLKIARAGDGIHPTDRGGADWADAFFAFYLGQGIATE